jgi:hypothetical protein
LAFFSTLLTLRVVGRCSAVLCRRTVKEETCGRGHCRSGSNGEERCRRFACSLFLSFLLSLPSRCFEARCGVSSPPTARSTYCLGSRRRKEKDKTHQVLILRSPHLQPPNERNDLLYQHLRRLVLLDIVPRPLQDPAQRTPPLVPNRLLKSPQQLRQLLLHRLGVRRILPAEKNEYRALERLEDVLKAVVRKVGREEILALVKVDLILLRLPSKRQPALPRTPRDRVERRAPFRWDELVEVLRDGGGFGDDVGVVGFDDLAVGDGGLEDHSGEGGEGRGAEEVEVGDCVLGSCEL